MNPEELKALLDAALKPVSDRLGKLEAAAAPAVPAVVDVEAAVSKALEKQAEIQRLAAEQAAAMKKAVDDAVVAATKPLIDKLEAAETKFKDLEAKAKLEAGAPERKTVTPAVSAVLAKAGLTLPDGDAKLEVQAIDAALSKLNLPTDKRIQLKNELHRVGAL
jgi:hypothetical protein